jgi:hypothetical protein
VLSKPLNSQQNIQVLSFITVTAFGNKEISVINNYESVITYNIMDPIMANFYIIKIKSAKIMKIFKLMKQHL